MFNGQGRRGHRAEQVAAQAWENLVSAVGTAGSSARTARRRASHLYGDASDRVESGTKEARRRAGHAYDALLGRKPPTPWSGFAICAAAGIVLGGAAVVLAQRLLSQSDRLALPDSFPVDESTDVR